MIADARARQFGQARRGQRLHSLLAESEQNLFRDLRRRRPAGDIPIQIQALPGLSPDPRAFQSKSSKPSPRDQEIGSESAAMSRLCPNRRSTKWAQSLGRPDHFGSPRPKQGPVVRTWPFLAIFPVSRHVQKNRLSWVRHTPYWRWIPIPAITAAHSARDSDCSE
jgi:hypothetical protein